MKKLEQIRQESKEIKEKIETIIAPMFTCFLRFSF